MLSKETYIVVYPDSLGDEPKGAVHERLHKQGKTGDALAKPCTSEKEVILNAKRGSQGQGYKDFTQWLEKVENCTTIQELRRLDEKLGDQDCSHDIWKHIKGQFKNKEVSEFLNIYKGKEGIAACWEFQLNKKDGRVYCYIDHASKTVLVLGATFTANEAHKNDMSKYKNFALLGYHTFKASEGNDVFKNIRKDEMANRKANEMTTKMAEAFVPIEQRGPEYISFLSDLKRYEMEYLGKPKNEKDSLRKELVGYIATLKELAPETHTQMYEDINQEKLTQELHPQFLNDLSVLFEQVEKEANAQQAQQNAQGSSSSVKQALSAQRSYSSVKQQAPQSDKAIQNALLQQRLRGR